MAAHTSDVTEVSVDYLRRLNAALTDILQQVNARLSGGTAPDSQTVLVSPVDTSLQVSAGSPGDDSGLTFDAAAALNQALSTMGGSVHDQLEWLSGVLSAMIGEVNAAIAAVGNANHLNDEQVDALITEFENTIGVHNPFFASDRLFRALAPATQQWHAPTWPVRIS